MYEVSREGVDPEADPFALAHRPLRIENRNIPLLFTPTCTRIPTSAFLYEPRVRCYEQFFGFPLYDPPTGDIAASDRAAYLSDHFHRDFAPFSLPVVLGKPLPAAETDFHPKPHWFCDLPSSSMRPEPKIYLSEAMAPTLSKPLPKCCSCFKVVRFPFMASLRHNICFWCLARGKVPAGSTTLDFFRIEPPEFPGNWTLADTNRLLALVAEFGDNWPDIAAKLKSHTAGECLLHFIRLPMFDQYYIADPLAVPDGRLPDEWKMLPFMVAPDPIASYVAFVSIVDRRIGSVVAEKAQKTIQEILAAKSGVMLFNQVPAIVTQLVELTAATAAELVVGDAKALIATMKELVRVLDQEVGVNFRDFENGLKEIHHHANRPVIRDALPEDEVMWPDPSKTIA
jgi:hypothetical protein